MSHAGAAHEFFILNYYNSLCSTQIKINFARSEADMAHLVFRITRLGIGWPLVICVMVKIPEHANASHAEAITENPGRDWPH